MHRKAGLAVAVAIALLALSMAACGEDQAFIDDYNKATKPLQRLNSGIGSGVQGGGSPEETAKEFEKLAETSARVNDDLAELEAPEDARADFDKLKAALARTEKNLSAVAEAAKASQPAKAQKAAEALIADSAKITQAENAVAAKVEG